MATATANGTLYYGPSTATYPSDGTYSGTVTVLWKEGNWYYVEANTSPKRRGYISAVTNIVGAVDSFTPTLLTRYTLSTTPSNEPTYQGPATNYKPAGSLGPNETVKFLSDNGSNPLTKIGDYAMLEYDITGSTQKKRGWFPHMKLTTTVPSPAFVRPITGAYFNSSGTYHDASSGTNAGGRDISIATGTPIVAVKSGTAEHFLVYYTKIGTNTYVGFGPYIKLTFDDGTGYAIYAHLSQFAGATVPQYATEAIRQSAAPGAASYATGSSVHYTQGQQIGKTGNYGMSTGPHLHFGLIINGSNVDPQTYIS